MWSTSGESLCGRMPWDQDKEGRCYFHSDVEKDPVEFRERFLEEIGRLRSSNSAEFNFSRFVLPDFTIESGGMNFEKPVIFWEAQFHGSLWFRNVTFQAVNFDQAIFNADVDFGRSSFQKATFVRTQFNGSARFEKSAFHGPVTFEGARFAEANFTKCRFSDESNFVDASFAGVRFPGAIFSGFAHFGRAIFEGDSYFRTATFNTGSFYRAVFHADANFGDTRFKEWFRFAGTQFLSWVNFEDAQFEGQVGFEPEDGHRTRFGGLANFDRAVFAGLTVFEEVEFLGPAVFVDAEVRGKLFFQDVVMGLQGTIDFRYVSLREDSAVEFVGHKESLYMDRVRLLHTDSTKARFRNVRWWRDARKRIVFDEVVLDEIRQTPDVSVTHSTLLNWLATDLEGKPSNRDQVVRGTTYGSVEGLYRELRKNYEESLRYPEAGDFYVREMEMQRLGRTIGPGLWNWRRRNLSLFSIYLILSKYGESYARALAWIVGSVLMFAVLRVRVFPSMSLMEAIALSLGALFQIAAETPIDHAQRVWSILILALFFLAVRRRLKR